MRIVLLLIIILQIQQLTQPIQQLLLYINAPNAKQTAPYAHHQAIVTNVLVF